MPPVIKENIPLAPLTTFGVGGPARYFATATTPGELSDALTFAHTYALPIFVLGGGSNVLVADKGFPGVAIQNRIMGFSGRVGGNTVVVTVGAGEEWDDVVARSVALGWAGIECLSGIPGTAGAAPVQNIGAYGQSIDTVIREVHAVEVRTGTLLTFQKEECDFDYRTSMFKRETGKHVIATLVMNLTVGGTPTHFYKDHRFNLSDSVKGTSPTLAEVRKAVIETRSKKGMVIMPEYKSYQSAGSFFKAPMVTREEYERIYNIVAREDSEKMEAYEPWHWETHGGKIKIAPAFLMEYTEFHKGYARGNVGISPKHSLAIINRGNATATEIKTLADDAQHAVGEKFGITLEPEVQLIGFDPAPPAHQN